MQLALANGVVSSAPIGRQLAPGRPGDRRCGSTPARIAAAFGVLCVLMLGGLPGSAPAATVSADAGVLRVSGGTRERNDETITVVGGSALFRDASAPVAAGPGCWVRTSDTVICGLVKNARLDVDLGDRDDTVRNDTALRAVLYGGSGEDLLIGGAGADQIQGGDGFDNMEGRGGPDSISTRGSSWIASPAARARIWSTPTRAILWQATASASSARATRGSSRSRGIRRSRWFRSSRPVRASRSGWGRRPTTTCAATWQETRCWGWAATTGCKAPPATIACTAAPAATICSGTRTTTSSPAATRATISAEARETTGSVARPAPTASTAARGRTRSPAAPEAIERGAVAATT